MPTFIVVYKMSYRSFLDRLRCRGRKKTKGNMMSMKLSPQVVWGLRRLWRLIIFS